VTVRNKNIFLLEILKSNFWEFLGDLETQKKNLQIF
jgi:hypothetical protein